MLNKEMCTSFGMRPLLTQNFEGLEGECKLILKWTFHSWLRIIPSFLF